MNFRQRASSKCTEGSGLQEWISDGGKVAIAILQYLFGQLRIQVWWYWTIGEESPEICLEM